MPDKNKGGEAMKRVHRAICAVIMCAAALVLFSANAAAAVYEEITVNIPVYCMKVNEDVSDIYKIILEPEGDAPAPEKDMLIITAGTSGIFKIHIDEPGDYKYTAYEMAGSGADHHDKRIYDITVFVVTDENDGLISKVAVRSAETGTKPASVYFEHGKYIDPPTPPHPDPKPDVPVEPDQPPAPVIDSDRPGEDPSTGAGLEDDGILIDVGTLVRKITNADTAEKQQALDDIENSFVGSIPVIYIAASVVVIIAAAAVFSSKRKENENSSRN